jgi:hypothetical protein
MQWAWSRKPGRREQRAGTQQREGRIRGWKALCVTVGFKGMVEVWLGQISQQLIVLG